MKCGGGTIECSGHGRCVTLKELASEIKVNGEYAGFSYGSDPNNANTWDASKIRTCLCDSAYTGYDCSQRKIILRINEKFKC